MSVAPHNGVDIRIYAGDRLIYEDNKRTTFLSGSECDRADVFDALIPGLHELQGRPVVPSEPPKAKPSFGVITGGRSA